MVKNCDQGLKNAAIICKWKWVLLALSHLLVENGKNRWSLKINEGALLLVVTMFKELKDVSCPIFIFIFIFIFHGLTLGY